MEIHEFKRDREKRGNQSNLDKRVNLYISRGYGTKLLILISGSRLLFNDKSFYYFLVTAASFSERNEKKKPQRIDRNLSIFIGALIRVERNIVCIRKDC